MLIATKPMALTPDQVWVFVCDDNGTVDVARLAHAPEISGFIALPIEAFDPRSLLPTYMPTGELLATAGDGPPRTTSTPTRTCSPDPEHP